MNITFKGTPVKLSGSPLAIGAKAPAVELVGKDLGVVKVGGAQGKYQIINVVPSLDTGVCAMQARKFNQEAASLENVIVYAVSVDLPFAMGRFCSTEGISNLIVASDFVNKDFGKKYGIVLEDSPLKGLLTRSVIVVNKEGEIIYNETCAEITSEPDYEAALKAIK